MSKDKWRAAHIAWGIPNSPSSEAVSGSGKWSLGTWDWVNDPPSEHNSRQEALAEVKRRIEVSCAKASYYGGNGDSVLREYQRAIADAEGGSESAKIQTSEKAYYAIVAPGEALIQKKKGWFW